MPITSLKLPDDLKQRVQSLVKGSDTSAHAFMLEAIRRAAEAAELRKRFGEDAAQAEEDTLRSGKAYDAREAFAYLEARGRGKKVRRPKAGAWRKSS
jgi:predicted transcriptional regulator